MKDPLPQPVVEEAPPFEMAYVSRVIVLFCLGWAVVYADRTVLYPMLPVIGREFRLSGAEMGGITSAYFLFYTTAQLTSGLLGDRLGLKRVLVLFSFVAAIGIGAIGLFAGSYLTLITFVALHGVGVGAYYPMAYSLTMYTVPRRMRGFSSAIIGSGMSVGLAAGLALAGPLYHGAGSWRFPFLVLAVPTFLVAAVYHRLIRDVRSPARRNPSILAVLKDRDLLCLNAAGFCSLYGYWVTLIWGPTFFQTERGLGLTASGVYTGLIALAAIPASLAAGRLTDRVGRKRLTLVLFPLAATSIFALAHVRSQLGLILGLLAYGLFGKLAWDPVAIAWVGDRVLATKPEAMGTAIGVFSFISVLSAIVAPVITGWIRDLTGSLTGGFYLGAMVALLGFFFALVPGETIKR